jgi:serine protease Do
MADPQNDFEEEFRSQAPAESKVERQPASELQILSSTASVAETEVGSGIESDIESKATATSNASSDPSSRREAYDIRRKAQQRRERAERSSPSSLSMPFLMTSLLFLAAWFVGPRMVEEYQYASMKGKLRAEYENAVSILDSQPLKKVSMASRLVAHKVKPSVVSIQTIKLEQPDDRIGGRLGALAGPVMEGFGSGVIVSAEGHILTNAHVVDKAQECIVELHDRRRYRAKEIGRDELSDIAVLKIEADNLIPAQWGDSDSLEVGSIVWAIGSPYRYEQTVTSGIISAKDRPGDGNRVQNLLQTDAAVNPGNSGGPLVNADGNVIGINTSIFGKTFQGISFAVPSETAKFIYQQILERGEVVRGYLGVRPSEVRHDVAERLNLPDLEGAILVSVERNSPAFAAGLKALDVVRSWNGKPIRSFNNLFRMAEMSQPGSVVEVSLIRDGEERSAQVTIGTAPPPRSRR